MDNFSSLETSAEKLALSSRVVTVRLPGEVANDLEKSQAVIKDLVGKLGCPGCHSGFDIRFILERQFVVDPRTLEVRGVNDDFVTKF